MLEKAQKFYIQIKKKEKVETERQRDLKQIWKLAEAEDVFIDAGCMETQEAKSEVNRENT